MFQRKTLIGILFRSPDSFFSDQFIRPVFGSWWNQYRHTLNKMAAESSTLRQGLLALCVCFCCQLVTSQTPSQVLPPGGDSNVTYASNIGNTTIAPSPPTVDRNKTGTGTSTVSCARLAGRGGGGERGGGQTLRYIIIIIARIQSETRMIASVLKQDPNTLEVQKNTLY